MIDDTGVAPIREARWWRVANPWRALRIAFLVVWLLWAGLIWWTAPREANVAQARADLAAGRVVVYEWGNDWDEPPGTNWLARAKPRSSGKLGPLFVWQQPGWRVRYAVLDRSSNSFSFDSTVDVSRYSGPEAASLGEDVKRATLATGLASGPVEPAWPLTGLAGGLLLLSMLLILVSEPAPVTGTRWFWFWLISGVPFGLGLLWWLAREHPWASPARPPLHPTGREPRRRWYLGLAAGVLTTIVAGLLVAILGSALPDWLVPDRR